MDDFATRLKAIMREKDMRQIDVANKSGINKGRISRWMSGSDMPSGKSIGKLAEVLGVSTDTLLGRKEAIEKFMKPTYDDVELPINLPETIPVIGKVAAGVPIEAQEDIVGEVYIEEGKKDYFALKVKGNSMSPRIMDGDIVLVHSQSSAEDGDLVIAMIDGEATCKVLKRNPYGVTLIPFNGAYSPLVYSGQEAAELRILGKVVESRHEW